jgi:uncharacterized protein YndB with AHSA1/START domain
MSTQAEVTTVRDSIVVDAEIERAFRVFTEDFGAFKPPSHNLLPVPIVETVFEARVGGHVYDRGADGSECRWARVLAYEPPHRVVISWDISPAWQLEADKEKTSEVEVRFIAEAPLRTRVELEHRNLDRHGDAWEGLREGVDGEQGWPLYLQRFADLIAGEL